MLWKNDRPEDAAICAWLRKNGVRVVHETAERILTQDGAAAAVSL